jgi:hypothetical protein
MNSTEHLLVCGQEEAGEIADAALAVAKAFSKSLRFGLDDIHPERQMTAIQVLVAELNDLEAIIEMLEESGIEFIGLHDRSAIDAKKSKVRNYMEYARERGRIDNGIAATYGNF